MKPRTRLVHPCGHERLVVGNLSPAEIARQIQRPCRACRQAAEAIAQAERTARREAERQAWLATPEGKAAEAAARERAARQAAEEAAAYALRHSPRWQPARWQSALTRQLKTAGLDVRTTESGVSDSLYLIVSAGGGETFKVRISDHQAPVGRGGYARYEEGVGDVFHRQADYEITPHTVANCGASWRAAAQAVRDWAAEIETEE